MQMSAGPKRLVALAAFAALGPVTGPLAAGFARNWRRGDRLLAALYAVAVIETWIALPTLAAHALAWLHH